MKVRGPLFRIIRDLKTVTAEHELKHGCPQKLACEEALPYSGPGGDFTPV